MRKRKRERERKVDWFLSCCKCERTPCGQQAPTWSTFWLLPWLHCLLPVPLFSILYLYRLPELFLQLARYSSWLRAFALAVLPDWRALFSNIAWLAPHCLSSLRKWTSITGELSLITLHKVSAHILRATILQDSREWHSYHSPHELWPLGRVEQGTAWRAKHSGLSITLSPPALLFFIVFNTTTWTSFLVNIFVSLIPSVMTASLSSDIVYLVYYYVSRD